MNIEEYRAMKSEEERLAQNPPVEEVVQPPETTVEEPTVPDVEQDTVQKIKLGDEEFEPAQIEEFRKGYLRQDEYFQRMQELQQKELEIEYAMRIAEEVQNDPEMSQKVAQKAPQLTPEAIRVKQMEQELENLRVEREVERLTAIYPDFDVQKVAKVIEEKKITNLEDAYKLSVIDTQKPETIDIEALKAQLKAEIAKELEASSVPSSLIVENGSPNVPQNDTSVLSPDEKRVARNMGLTEKEYIKWRG